MTTTIFKMYHTDADGTRRLYKLCLACTVKITLDKRKIPNKITRGVVAKCDYCNGNLSMGD